MKIFRRDIVFFEEDGTLFAKVKEARCAEYGENPRDWSDIATFSMSPDCSTIERIECPNHDHPLLAGIVEDALECGIDNGDAEIERYFRKQAIRAEEDNDE